MNNRELFYSHLAQTSPAPLALEIDKADGVYLYDTYGKKYIDFISGISVSNIGHRHPNVLKAVNAQLEKYMHLMVYGEYVQSPQVLLAKALADVLPQNLSSCYFVNSGAEAIEGAIKLAKRFTGRPEIISFTNSYHGSTTGALSIMGSETFKNSFRPLLPATRTLEYNNFDQLYFITEQTACVVIEPVQGEAGIIIPHDGYLKSIYNRCKEVGALLVLDEIQTGFGRTGNLFAFQEYEFTPDILVLAKGMGGGMPIGAFIASKEIMNSLTHNPVLGHITTFGGHPVSCAAALATLQTILNEKITDTVLEKSNYIVKNIKPSPLIKSIRAKGLLIGIEFESEQMNFKVIEKCIASGLITDWFLFNASTLRIAPPLTISQSEMDEALFILNECIQNCND
ncbi:MAG: aspartate aminotransferase family protein [Bacteroidetes bacterium]|nr:aspartate aminotransferase family protein [Bacteroidota bacterium]